MSIVPEGTHLFEVFPHSALTVQEWLRRPE
ncbi:hypothetical protein PGAAJM_12965 [Kocuria varians]